MKKKKVLFILSGNLSTTPRALKSILSMKDDYHCDTLLVNRMKSWKDKDFDIIKSNNLNVTTLELGRDPFFNWFKSTILEKGAKLIYKKANKNISVNAYASNKAAIILKTHLSTLNLSDVDLVIGHSEGSMYPCWYVNKKWSIPFVFDVEDFHPGETISVDTINEKNRREYLMKTILPEASGLIFASPLIGKYTLDLIGDHPNSDVILNGFNDTEFKLTNNKVHFDEVGDSLRFVWFSQKIGYGRGLEELFEALSKILLNSHQVKLDLTLIGELDEKFNTDIIQNFQKKLGNSEIKVNVESSLPQKELHERLSRFDVGLALEFNSSDLNRQICLTNKIITYAQAGLFILATDTKAQKQFLHEFTELGALCGQTVNEIENSILELLERNDEIKREKEQRFEIGKQLSWNTEEKKLRRLWKKIL
ncbi:glycosyltransferase (GTnc) [Formosa agariphila KMM 3901]|uniref:Glycosyltransferase (GTnc) n=1 Tax=Formosa agariphila (strain DSM 15362 / KCTC 12365 / LMG 23005 / KMM 3901 / M-2Alg 35-1) TaxID=1347342 RepID=T2KPF0_FORAG|nr:hypothetical protein [Formosa agariphila]CDF80630.1 glycosyltransferase (GTnc) [Formosa agariphila KMM 3901]